LRKHHTFCLRPWYQGATLLSGDLGEGSCCGGLSRQSAWFWLAVQLLRRMPRGMGRRRKSARSPGLAPMSAWRADGRGQECDHGPQRGHFRNRHGQHKSEERLEGYTSATIGRSRNLSSAPRRTASCQKSTAGMPPTGTAASRSSRIGRPRLAPASVWPPPRLLMRVR
jgi:hypothetical protein